MTTPHTDYEVFITVTPRGLLVLFVIILVLSKGLLW